MFENIYSLAAGGRSRIDGGCMGHVRLSDSAGAQPSGQYELEVQGVPAFFIKQLLVVLCPFLETPMYHLKWTL